jgi:radical SAM protein with 4Fe4S-binding SPASM domain
VRGLLQLHGGCSAGTKFVDITADGTAYPCQFWHQESFGNVRERSLASLWSDTESRLLCQLRHKAEALKGRCGRCRYKHYCGGCRVRAAVVHNDFWAEDPCCYLTDEEIS